MPRKDESLVKSFRNDIDTWFTYWSKNIANYNFYTRFTMEGQWTEDEKRALDDAGAEPLEFNKLGAIINNILGDQRQHTPNLQVVCVSEKVQPETVTLMQQIVKTIAFNSESRIAYQHAFQCALVGGFGAIEVDTEYESENTFDQCIKIKKVEDPVRCFWDPAATSTGKTDGRFAGKYFTMSREEFKKRYPRVEVKNEKLATSQYTWADEKNVMIAVYFRKELKKKTLLLLNNGQSLDKAKYDGPAENIIKEREAFETIIKRYKIAGDTILDETEWPAKGFGIIFVDQNSVFIDNKQITRPFIKDAIDSQRVLNHLGTKTTYLIKATRYDQWKATKVNIAGQEPAWNNPQNYKGVLLYEPDNRFGQTFVPERNPPAELPQTFLAQYERARQDIMTCLGIYEAQLGSNGNEISGAAIDSRVKHGKTSTFVTFDSLNRAIAEMGEVIVQLIPKIMDTERTLVLDTEDAGLKAVTINKGIANGQYAAGYKNDITQGQYKIHLDAGASFEGQKMEALQSLQQIITAQPQLFPMVADLYAENLPLTNTRELVNRLRTIVPPDVIKAGKGEKPEPKPQQPDPAMMMQMQQMQMHMKELELKEQELANKREQIEAQKQELQLKAAQIVSGEHIQQLKTAGEIQKAHIDGQATEINALLKHHQLATEAHKLLKGLQE